MADDARRRRRVALGALVLVTALAGCSTADGEVAAPSTAAASTTVSTVARSTPATSSAPTSGPARPSSSVPPSTVPPSTGAVAPATTTVATLTATTAGPPARPAPAPAPGPPTTNVPPPMLADLATDPDGLAAQLTGALRTILDDGAPADAVAAAGRRQQLVYRRLAARPEWQEATVAAVPADLRTFVANDVIAVNAPGDRTLAKPVPPLENLPAWTIRAPLPIDELRGYYDEGAAATGIPWTYLAAINLVETRMGRIVGLSSANAIGPMQFLRSTWNACCEGDPTVDRDAIIGAAVYLQRRGGPADMRRAVLGYNPNDAYLTMIDRYATNLALEPRLYRGYHAWQVFVSTVAGPVRLPVGFRADVPVPAADHVASHPEDRA